MSQKNIKAQLKDIKNNDVLVGDKVLLLVKEYGYRKLSDASIEEVIYVGPGPYGYEFIYEDEEEDWDKDPGDVTPFRIKKPELFNLEAYSKNCTR